MALVVTSFEFTPPYKTDFKRAPPDIQSASDRTLKQLLTNSNSGSLRLHTLKGYPKPTIFKIDVIGHSWQITFEMIGSKANLLRLGTHKELDRNPRKSAQDASDS
jgi:hypothetical protein